MEPPKGFWATLRRLFHFLPFFLGLLLLGIIKGALFCPLVCLIITIGNSAIILGLWPVHAIWTFYCIARAQLLGPVLKLLLSIGLLLMLVLWPLAGILGSILFGLGYGFFEPILATFGSVGEGKTNEFFHCFVDGTWESVQGSFTIVRDMKDVCFHSYFSIMDDLRLHDPSNGIPYEIRLLYLPGAFLVGVLGCLVDVPMITLIAICKSPWMLLKGWRQLFHDLIGREGPFLETACVPFAGLAILLWPLAVVGAVTASILSSFVLGSYAAVVTYQESSFHMGLAYVLSALSIFDEYSNDVLDMPEGSCFPRPQYRKKEWSRASSFSRPSSVHREKPESKNPPSRVMSFKNVIIDMGPFKLLELLFTECKRCGEILIAEGSISREDIEGSKSNKVGNVFSIGLPAYCILQTLLRSAKADTDGLLLSNNTEITTTNRPKDAFFEYFFDPLMIIKEQIKAQNFTEEEEDYLGKMVLWIGLPERLKTLNAESAPQNERRRAEIDALTRRLQGITKSISRYPTFRRRFDEMVKSLSEELERKMGVGGSVNGSRSTQRTQRTRSGLARMFSQKSFGSLPGPSQENDQERLRSGLDRMFSQKSFGSLSGPSQGKDQEVQP